MGVLADTKLAVVSFVILVLSSHMAFILYSTGHSLLYSLAVISPYVLVAGYNLSKIYLK